MELLLTACFMLVSILATSCTPLDPAHCPPALCANPKYNRETSCSSCEGSRCMLRGCVHNGAFFTTWMPDNCTVCNCMDNEEVCTAIDCAPVECYGYPVVTRPGRCCSECDFNISATECGAVPVATRSLYVSIGDSSCQRDVVERGCDKRYVIEDDGEYGAWFACEPVQQEVTQSLEDLPGCANWVSHVTYKTVTGCEKRRLSSHEIPQDYDPEPRSCYYYVDPKTSGGPKIPKKPDPKEPDDPIAPLKAEGPKS